MLKSLEIVGFKSFAEKTRFEFSAGITAIVGPNGSGKSNIVDAVRWILGEQRAKSLRGGEMSDVIFNGASGRKSLGIAEVTLTFDNSKHILNTDQEMVEISRRVYRDGTGEYLINRQMSRLKDIRELFLGSGASGGANCIIEQGRVDALLQASSLERRALFEEVSGVSRFKARKNETLKKLEQVEQNLDQLLLLDSEIQNQFRKTQQEANRAKQFLQHSQRLRQLRIGLGLREFRLLEEQLRIQQQELHARQQSLQDKQHDYSSKEAASAELELELQNLDAQLQNLYEQRARQRQEIANLDTRCQAEWSRELEYQEEYHQSFSRFLELRLQLWQLQQLVNAAWQEWQSEHDQAKLQQIRADELDQHFQALSDNYKQSQQMLQELRVEQMDCVRRCSLAQSQMTHFNQQFQRQQLERDQRRKKLDQLRVERDSLQRVLEGLSESDADVQTQINTAKFKLAEATQDNDSLRRLIDHLRQEDNQLQLQRSAVRGRIEILETLERSQEGLSLGVRDLVAKLRAEAQASKSDSEFSESSGDERLALNPSPESTDAQELIDHRKGEQSLSDFPASDPRDSSSAKSPTRKRKAIHLQQIIYGLVADLLQVPRSIAAEVDLALGEVSQRFVVSDIGQIDRLLQEYPEYFQGQIGFIPYQELDPLAEGNDTLTADRWVTCASEELAGLPRQLLGNVRIVDDLSTARFLAVNKEMDDLEEENLSPSYPALRFVTKKGELLEPDGTLIVGPARLEGSIVSRKSELRDLLAQAAQMDRESQTTKQRIDDLLERVQRLEGPIASWQQEIDLLTSQAGNIQSELWQHQQHLQHLDGEIQLMHQETLLLEQEYNALFKQCEEAAHTHQQSEQHAAELKHKIEDCERHIHLLEQERFHLQTEQTNARIRVAQTEERVTASQERYDQLEADLRRGQDEELRVQRHWLILQRRLQEQSLQLLEMNQQAAQIFSAKEEVEREIIRVAHHREEKRHIRYRLNEELKSIYQFSEEQRESLHRTDLKVRDLVNQHSLIINQLKTQEEIDLNSYSLALDRYLNPVNSPSETDESLESPQEADSDQQIPDQQNREEEGRQAIVGPGGSSSREIISEAKSNEGSPNSTRTIQESSLPNQAQSHELTPAADTLETTAEKIPIEDYLEYLQEDIDLGTLKQEMKHLEGKINSLGRHINLDSIPELEAIEKRAKEFAAQLADLSESQRSLREIIDRINQDTQKRFSETYETVRVHFQELFRRLFGGGEADLVLENPNDLLESGVEIMARPPGKEIRNLTLLSGGEKTMTAVALLLAIFRSKPAPFCLLDEVDAALDEANTTRLAAALREFMHQSQFIIITHKKRTMAVADVLYGVTMQESGVSKLVSVRLEDWSDEKQQVNRSNAA